MKYTETAGLGEMLTRRTLEQIVAFLWFTDGSGLVLMSCSCDHIHSQTFILQNCDFVILSEMLQEYVCNSGSKHISLHLSEKMPEFVSIFKT